MERISLANMKKVTVLLESSPLGHRSYRYKYQPRDTEVKKEGRKRWREQEDMRRQTLLPVELNNEIISLRKLSVTNGQDT